MKVIIDCNVLIAAGLKNGVCRAVLNYALEHCTIFLTQEILLEYLLVIRRPKFKHYITLLEKLVKLLCDVAPLTENIEVLHILPDPKDLIYIQAAASIQADYIITGNIKDFPSLSYDNTQIISPHRFHELYVDILNKPKAI